MNPGHKLCAQVGYEHMQLLTAIVSVGWMIVGLKGSQQFGQVVLSAGSRPQSEYDPLKTKYDEPIIFYVFKFNKVERKFNAIIS
jgi:hypothetical protein